MILRQGLPSSLFWQGRFLRIKNIHNRWVIRQNWHRQETHRAYFRVETENKGIYDLYQELGNGQWILERVYD